MPVCCILKADQALNKCGPYYHFQSNRCRNIIRWTKGIAASHSVFFCGSMFRLVFSQNLIIDIRRIQGGNSANSEKIAEHLISKKQKACVSNRWLKPKDNHFRENYLCSQERTQYRPPEVLCLMYQRVLLQHWQACPLQETQETSPAFITAA